MEYHNIFEPLLCIFLSMIVGVLIGTIFTLVKLSKEQKSLYNELDKFRGLYFAEIDRWKNKYTNDKEV